LQAGDGDGDLAGPGPAFGGTEPEAPAAAGEPPGDVEQAQAEPFRFPAAGVPARASIWVQARTSQARETISHQTWFWA
jgi:hypothetical protein